MWVTEWMRARVRGGRSEEGTACGRGFRRPQRCEHLLARVWMGACACVRVCTFCFPTQQALAVMLRSKLLREAYRALARDVKAQCEEAQRQAEAACVPRRAVRTVANACAMPCGWAAPMSSIHPTLPLGAAPRAVHSNWHIRSPKVCDSPPHTPPHAHARTRTHARGA